ncbi:Urb2/Npa2 family-domain-containing protein [Nemania sp. FL0916]|nr:Urb2/Npa2 family-domain-containing protein [Nemania sp. FL0916]
MEAMDVDESGPSQQLALIRLVRTLDEPGSLSSPEKIFKLCDHLTRAPHTRLHGVEESILRWLLKQMSGDTDSAEHVRRYAFTWKVLGLVFPKIPAQALGRSLAYLRFVSILNKTLAEITNREDRANDNQPRRRKKRSADCPPPLEELRTCYGWLGTTFGVFEALAILLEQATAESEDVTPEQRVGAEHIKSLFSSSGDETRDITARLLLLCDDSLSVPGSLIDTQQSWIEISTNVWNLRLRNKDDSFEFAKHIYERASLILAKLEDEPAVLPAHQTRSVCYDIWARHTRRLLSTYFIRPARQRFSSDKNIDMPKLALEIAKQDVVASTTVMWNLAATTPRNASDPRSKIEHNAWVEDIFQAVVNVLHSLADQKKNDVLCRLLDSALRTQSIPDTQTLRTLYQKNALHGDEIDWKLLSKILACDPDVFLNAEDSTVMFDNITRVSNGDTETKDEVVSDVVRPLQDAFSNARDLAGFITHWYRSLCTAESVEKSIWFDLKIREHLATIIQKSLSSSQLLRLLEELESTANNKAGLLVVLDGICSGLSDESMIADVKSKISSMMDRKWEDIYPDILALRWRVISCLASWETSDKCNHIWKKVKSDLKPVLKKSPLEAAETFEAFSCCYKLCLSNHIGGKYEEDITKLVSTTLGRIMSAVNTEGDIQVLQPYLDLVFNSLPRLAEQPRQEDNDLADQIVKLFLRMSYQIPSLPAEQCRGYVQPLIHSYDVADEEPMVDALMTPLLDALDSSDNQCGWTQPHSLNIVSLLLEFPVECWTRGRRKRIMSSWKKQKSVISSYVAKDSNYALAVLRLLAKLMQQVTFYEGMEFADLANICSGVTTGDTTILGLTEKFVHSTISQILTNSNELTQSYLLTASQDVKNIQLGESATAFPQIILLKGLSAAISDYKSSNGSLERIGLDPGVFQQKLAKLIEQALSAFSLEASESSVPPLTEETLRILSVVLDAAEIIDRDQASTTDIELPGDTLDRLERAGRIILPKNAALAWKLKSFLMRQSADRYTAESFAAMLDEADHGVEEELLHGFVDAYVQGKGQSVRDQLLEVLMDRETLFRHSIGPLMAARRLLELYQGPNVEDKLAGTQGGLDLAQVHEHFTSHLCHATFLTHFKQISEIMLFLLDKHANAMTQYNIDATLTSVVEVCSTSGPGIHRPAKAPGEIFTALFKLVALIIKRHRLRLSGRSHLLLAALRALLTVLLADPTTISSLSRARHPLYPPWLISRLQPRHGDRFARLLTLICEPSAAAVARSHSRGSGSALDSAIDVAKRAAGQYMYLVVEMYVKLQLEGEVTRDMRRALEVGIFSVLDITTEGGRRVLNESLDASGCAVFKGLFAEYRKFGKWKGV